MHWECYFWNHFNPDLELNLEYFFSFWIMNKEIQCIFLKKVCFGFGVFNYNVILMVNSFLKYYFSSKQTSISVKFKCATLLIHSKNTGKDSEWVKLLSVRWYFIRFCINAEHSAPIFIFLLHTKLICLCRSSSSSVSTWRHPAPNPPQVAWPGHILN